MANDQRPYRPVSVDMIGVESGLKRFTKDGVTNLPPVARWRNNLTALSHHKNLFFCATGDCVAVYQPEFPYQTLNRHPALLIKPELANSHALGYMSQRRNGADGHCINHLVTGELGTQEILLLATDSGNVEAYYTISILDAIQTVVRNGLDGSCADAVGLRPFFKHWVCQSAWGLDIHKEARMIAVSSNVPSRMQPTFDDDDVSSTITVFAFALTQTSLDLDEEADEEDTDSVVDAEWMTWGMYQDLERPERDRNYKVLLKGCDGHVHNVPNISFVNTAEDSDGVWLLSTDITGIMKLWQIWKGTCLRQWDFSNEDNLVGPWMNASYPGWNVAALDVNMFRPVGTNAEFIGAERAPIHYGYHDRGPSFNLTAIARQIPESSRFHPLHLTPPDTEDLALSDHIFNDRNLDDDDDDVDEDDAILDDEDTMEDVQALSPASASTVEVQQRQAGDHDSMSTHLIEQPLEFEFEQEDDDSEFSSDEHDRTRSDEERNNPSGDEDATMQPPGSRRISQMRSKVKPYQFPNVSAPRIAMIHCSDTHIRMLGSPKARYPHIFCANVVRQSIPEHILDIPAGAELQVMDRLNMIQKIPELGILLVATQAGRVAVCSLTRKGDLFGFRVDWVLPTKKQERAGQRPNLCTLLGMAVAPIQGSWSQHSEVDDDDERLLLKDGVVDGVKTTFDPNVVVLRNRPTSNERQAQRAGLSVDPKLERRSWKKAPRDIPPWQAIEHNMRYRVMLTYTDLSVLTYEVSRKVDKIHEA